MPDRLSKLRENLRRVNEQISNAATAADRSPSEVNLVAVTKYVDIDTTKLLFEAGCNSLGESRPQVLIEKATELASFQIQWHMIGTLQRNKIRKLIEHTHLVHSVDSLKLLESINRIAQEQEIVVDALLQINVSGELQKHGFNQASIHSEIEHCGKFENVRLRGMMCMSGLTSSAQQRQREFGLLRETLGKCAARVPDPQQFNELSMGMSGDFELAIAEGATMVRIGSALFEGIRD